MRENKKTVDLIVGLGDNVLIIPFSQDKQYGYIHSTRLYDSITYYGTHTQ